MPTFTESFGWFPGIGIQYDSSSAHALFRETLRNDLYQISSRSLGRQLLDQIADARPRVRTTANSHSSATRAIVFRPGINVVITPTIVHYVQRGYRRGQYIGSSTTEREIVPSNRPEHNVDHLPYYRTNGSFTEAVDAHAADDGTGTVSVIRYSNATMRVEGGVVTPSFIVLVHELIHALHHVTGTRLNDHAEELWTTGIGHYGQYRMTENTFRWYFGLPERPSYY